MKSLGLYLHIPFCRSKCLYCDFCSSPDWDDDLVRRYVSALRQDLVRRASSCSDYTVDTVYFGGGTPTVLSPALLLSLLDTVRACYHVSPDAEITLECNPATGSPEGFRQLRLGGFNRLSIGLQSVHDHELRALGRIHRFSDFCSTFSHARASGFDNISADLMSGIPEQTPESWLDSIRRLVSLAPTHVSAYGLIVEEGTPFYGMRDRLPLPDEETARQMYFDGIDCLASYGYAQYEISNFAKVGYESRHNLKYWNCEEYLGFGPAAYSDFDGARFGNSRDLLAYIDGRSIESEREVPSLHSRMNEYVMLRMRLCAGVSASAFQKRFGASFEECFGNALSAFLPMGLVRRTGDGLAFTPEGLYVSNSVLSEVLDFSS